MLVSQFITISYTLRFSTAQGLLAALHLEFVTSIKSKRSLRSKSWFESAPESMLEFSLIVFRYTQACIATKSS